MKNHVSGEEVVYQYDSLARLTSATAQIGATPTWSQTYSYDGFGNLFAKGGLGLAAAYNGDWSTQLNSAKNQVGAHSVTGNRTGFEYDLDNRVKVDATLQWSYTYAHDNKRVIRKKANGGRFVDFYSGNQRLGTYELQSSNNTGEIQYQTVTVKTELYLGGKRVASEDRLGSATDARLLPYGEEISTTPNERVKFATYQRDETGVDYADQRYYQPGNGRFLTPDPFGGSAKASAPGSWNRYAYVDGDPVNLLDPRGLYAQAQDSSSVTVYGQIQPVPFDIAFNSHFLGGYSFYSSYVMYEPGGGGGGGVGAGGNPPEQNLKMKSLEQLKVEECSFSQRLTEECGDSNGLIAAVSSRWYLGAWVAWHVAARAVGNAGERVVASLIKLQKNKLPYLGPLAYRISSMTSLERSMKLKIHRT